MIVLVTRLVFNYVTKKLLRFSNSLVSSLIILYFYKTEICFLCERLYGLVKFIIVIWYSAYRKSSTQNLVRGICNLISRIHDIGLQYHQVGLVAGTVLVRPMA